MIELPDTHFEMAVQSICHRLNPMGFDVADDAPQDYEAMLDHFLKTGRICVWSGASDKTIFSDPEVNYAFRAWHDWCHITARLPFTPTGEVQAANLQCSHIVRFYGDSTTTRQWRAVIWAEVVGQALYHELHQRFPLDQKAFDIAFITEPPEVALGRAF